MDFSVFETSIFINVLWIKVEMKLKLLDKNKSPAYEKVNYEFAILNQKASYVM